jgi:hypothetical protein
VRKNSDDTGNIRRDGHDAALNDVADKFRDLLAQLGKSAGMRVSQHTDRDRLDLEFWRGAPLWIAVDIDSEARLASVYGVVRTFGLPGDRSDYHELISAIWAIGLRMANVASVRLVDIEHPVVRGELYGRYVVPDSQPSLLYISMDHPETKDLQGFLLASTWCAYVFSVLFRTLADDPDGEEYDDEEGREWATRVARALGLRLTSQSTSYNARIQPDWLYYHREDHGITAITFDTAIAPLFSEELLGPGTDVMDGETALMVRSSEIQNAIPHAALEKLGKVLKAYELDAKPGARDLTAGEGTLIVPTESHLFCVTDAGIVSLRTECVRRRFGVERETALRRHREVSRFLYREVAFEWQPKLNPARYEALILDLLKADDAVRWARQVGDINASDEDRDIVADWLLPPAPWEKAHEDAAFLQRRRVVVQCKARGRPVNFSHLPNIPMVLQYHDADAYLLVADPRVTKAVVNYFTTVPQREGFWADWWTRTEVEERLRICMEILPRYTDLVRVRD